uniref:Uncharacterized protein n=1 Tax=Tanacetum cinerariifolium TaxID=118510 RepID=A0A699JPK5_TANCI|nr:hypothetical protein [Tanacetum cinerariifolium]
MDSQSTPVVSAAKLPILNPNEFDLWKMRIEQYFLMTDYSLWEVIINGDSVISRVAVDDAKTLMEAIEKHFGGNTKTKKVQKTLLKQQFENFTGSSSEDWDQIHDRLQKLVSQLEIHEVSLSQESVNLKFLCILPSEWKTHTLMWRNKANLEEPSLDDLFNSLKIHETEVRHSSSPNNQTQNLAFVSSSNTDSTTDSVSAATSVSAVYVKLPVTSHPNIDSLKDEPANFALMAIPSSSSSDNEATLESIESRLVVYKQNESIFQENIIVLKIRWKLSPSGGYHDVPPPITGNFMPLKPDLVFNTALLDVESDHSAFNVQVSPAKPAQVMLHTTKSMAPIIEDWVSNSEDESDPMTHRVFLFSLLRYLF